MSIPFVIGFCGRARHGKDFIAQIVYDRFTDAGISCFLSSVSIVVHEDAYQKGLIKSPTRADCTPAELDFLVKHGHDGRLLDENLWMNQMAIRIAKANPDVAIIPGVRFPNEIPWFHERDGVLCRVVRLNIDGSVFISRDRDPNDPMETALDIIPADYEIRAKDSQLDWLRLQGEGFAAHILNKIRTIH